LYNFEYNAANAFFLRRLPMRCYFLRHGLAVDAGEWGSTDFDRPLTREGRERMKAAAKTIAALRLNIDVIVTSPLVRAKQTATFVAKRLELEDRLVEDARLAGGFGLSDLGEILAEHRTAEAIMLVGHEPGMSRTVGEMVGGANIDFKPGSLACVNVPEPASPGSTLLWLIPSKVLALTLQ
jgi:phosphohistidine phosphatase